MILLVLLAVLAKCLDFLFKYELLQEIQIQTQENLSYLAQPKQPIMAMG